MHISSIRVEGYRCFEDQTIEFNQGLNVIIGENNAGKTALFDALKLIFERSGRDRPSVHDFHRCEKSEESTPPEIRASVTLRSDGNDTDDDLGTVATWLTTLDDEWEATLTYEFVLPEQNHGEFRDLVQDGPGDNVAERYWYATEAMLDKYVSRIYGGEPSRQNRAEPEMLAKFDLQFLDAIRDAEAHLRSGSHPLLRRMLRSVLDSTEDLQEKRTENERAFYESTQELIFKLKKRVDKETLFRLLEETGAGEEEMGELDLEGRLTEVDLLAALRLVLRKHDFDIPVTHNGLGYNNLIYISLVLRDLSLRAAEKDNENAPIFPLLLIEEPEAHLHPSLQYRLLIHLRERLHRTESAEMSRQVFITTHSTHVTAAAGLDSIICMYLDDSGKVGTAYPGRVYDENDPDEQSSKAYVERYLDATKSAMLFSKSTLFVEGAAEMQLLPCLAEHAIGEDEGITSPLDRNYVSLIGVDGLCFKHFMPLFGAVSSHERAQFALPRRVACLIDADPKRKHESETHAKSCWPYELHQDGGYEYYSVSHACKNLKSRVEDTDNIRVFHGEKTLEYDLAKVNRGLPLLITSSCTHQEKLAAFVCGKEEHDDLKRKARDALQALEEWEPPEADGDGDNGQSVEERRAAARFATHYLLSVQNAKGGHAFELEAALRENLRNGTQQFALPKHIRSAVRWVCSDDEETQDEAGTE